MTRLLTLLFLFTLSQASGYVPEKSRNKKTSHRKQAKAIVKEQINKLKDGALLVRLQTKANTIAALREMGDEELSDEVNEKQLNYNKGIITAFKNNFTFCPVYFFYSNYSDSILAGQINGIVFVNDNLQPDTTIKLNNGNFLTAEFGMMEQDTAKYFSNYYYYPGENGPERKSEYYGTPNMRGNVLKIMSDHLVQLKRPFPYYVKTFDSLPFKRKLSKTVLRMNKKLLSCYEKSNEI
jgi:hypothetical protein